MYRYTLAVNWWIGTTLEMQVIIPTFSQGFIFVSIPLEVRSLWERSGALHCISIDVVMPKKLSHHFYCDLIEIASWKSVPAGHMIREIVERTQTRPFVIPYHVLALFNFEIQFRYLTKTKQAYN